MSLRDIYESGFDEESGKTTNAEACPECEGQLLTEAGEISCRVCGLVIDASRIDHGPEWRRFDDEDDNPERTGAPLTPGRHDRGLSTEIGYGGDANGHPLSGRKRAQISRLRREHSRARWRTKAERNLAHACSEIARMTSALDFPTGVREEASAIYRNAHAEGLIQGRSIETMAAGSLYAACRCRGYPQSVAEIADVARCSEQKITLGYRVLNVELGLDAQVVGVAERIPRFASAFNASDRVQHRALELAELAMDAGLTNGRNPSGVAGACLYLAGLESDRQYTQAELAHLADVSPATIRKRYYELRDEVA